MLGMRAENLTKKFKFLKKNKCSQLQNLIFKVKFSAAEARKTAGQLLGCSSKNLTLKVKFPAAGCSSLAAPGRSSLPANYWGAWPREDERMFGLCAEVRHL